MDPLYIKNLSWKGDFAPSISDSNYFEKTVSVPTEEPEAIEGPFLVIQTLHSCYSHALIEEISAYFTLTLPRPFHVLIRRDYIDKFPDQNLPSIGDITYNSVWKSLIEILSPFPPIFEHRLDPTIHYSFKECYVYPLNDGCQRSIWNCGEYYTGRNIELKDTLYSDSILYENLLALRRHVLGGRTPSKGGKLLLIERKSTRRFDHKLLLELQYYSSSTEWEYEEPYILEDMTFEEQVDLFSNAKVVIFRHGSCLANLLWVPEGTIVFDLDVQRDRKNIVTRVCKLTNSIHHYLDYNRVDIKREIFDVMPSPSASS
jgi:hypothetical protein